MMGSLLARYVERVAGDAVRDFFKSPAFKAQVSQHVKWAVQGFEPGYTLKHRQAFTATVAERIHEKARRPVMLFGRRIWRAREPMAWCLEEAERIVTEFLKDEKIRFGDPRYYWDDGVDLADADMDYWEGCP